MRNQHSIEARTQETWPPEFIQEIDAIFADIVPYFRQIGFSQDEINAYFRLIENKAHDYYHLH